VTPMVALLIVLLIIVCIGGLPAWGYHPYGGWPSGGVGLLLLIVLILVLTGHL